MKKIKKHQANIIVKSIIFSDFIYWVSWNFLAPLFSVFVVNEISGGNIQVVSSSFSFFMIMRTITTYTSGRFFNGLNEHIRLIAVVSGIIIMSISYLILAMINEIHAVYIFYGLAGFGMGLSDPLKLVLFAKHIDASNESKEAGLWNSTTLLGSSIASFIGGLIVYYFSFQVLFSVAALANIMAVIPYVYIVEIYEKRHGNQLS